MKFALEFVEPPMERPKKWGEKSKPVPYPDTVDIKSLYDLKKLHQQYECNLILDFNSQTITIYNGWIE
jgi:hypothetical protein